MYIGPDSLFCVLFALAIAGGFALWVIREGNENDRHKRAALANRFCVHCGYNVHGCGSDRCPECGTPIPPPDSLPRPRKPL